MSEIIVRSSNLFRERKRLLGLISLQFQPDLQRKSPEIRASSLEIVVFLRPAEQGGRGGRCSGGAAALSLAAFLFLFASEGCVPVLI